MTEARTTDHASPAVRGPSPHASLPRRPSGLRLIAWAGALTSLAVAAAWVWGSFTPGVARTIQGVDVALGAFFVVEFFTRPGWRTHRFAYLRWRWFDAVAIIPITVLGPVGIAPLVWFIVACRAIRLVDRTLGDGFVQRKAILLVSIVEEELSDRLLVKMLRRWERELDQANFGAAIAAALVRNQKEVLGRVYAEQLQEGAFAKVAHFTGLQAALEREEARLFGALVEMVGSKEIDAAIRDLVASSLRRSREELGVREWRRKPGATPSHAKRRPRHAPRPVVGA